MAAPRKPDRHGHDHRPVGFYGPDDPGGADPAPGTPPGTGTPRVATFYRLDTDDPQTITSGAGRDITWTHAQLPSDGSITGPTISDQHAEFNVPLVTIETVYVQWEDATFERAVVFGTNSRIITGDRFGEANQGDGSTGADGSGKQWVTDFRMNAYVAGDLSQVYVQIDSGSRDILQAWWVIYAWPAPGYLGAIPGYPL